MFVSVHSVAVKLSDADDEEDENEAGEFVEGVVVMYRISLADFAIHQRSQPACRATLRTALFVLLIEC